MYDAFQYQDSNSLQGLPIQGQYSTYDGSGYLYELRGQLSFIQGNLSLLKQMEWIDRQTRAVFIEFSVYNPNINLVMVSTILVEFLPSGSILTLSRFDPLNLFAESGQNILSFKILCEIIFIGFIFYFLIMEIRNFLNKDLHIYISEFWNYLEWSIIITAFISFGMFYVRLTTAQEVLNFFKQTSGYAYIKLQKVNNCNQTLTYSLGLCSTFGTIKILKMIQFNRNIALLSATLRRCCGELISFSLFFFLIYMSFVQLFYLIYGSDLQSYSSFIYSMEGAFLMMLGKSSASDFIQANPILGPFIYACYNVVILCFALNIFISIITDAFDELREEAKIKPNEFDLLSYLISRIKKFISKKPDSEKIISLEKYNNHIELFPIQVERFANGVYRVIICCFLKF